MLQNLKVTSLNQLALICGLPIPTVLNKTNRISSIINGLALTTHLPTTTNLNILSMDIGIKNFSYCQMDGIDISRESGPSRICKWSKFDLHLKYAPTFRPLVAPESTIDTKRYLNHLCTSLIDDIVVLSTSRPHIIVMEMQRTRSTGNRQTLPNVLLNYTFENILYSTLYNLSISNPKYSSLLIVPMHSASMLSFWINRFITRPSQKKYSKHIRTELVYSWLDSLYLLDGFSFTSEKSRNKQLLAHLQIRDMSNNKIDDLVDSLLYNLTIKAQFTNQIHLSRLLDGGDIEGFIENKLYEHIQLIKPVVDKLGLELVEDYKKFC